MTDGLMHCPACKAQQPWSDGCRRCKCDLSLLRTAWRSSQQARTLCLAHLRAGRFDQARREARLLHRLCPNDDSLRLLAVCCLLAGDYSGASSVARHLQR